MSNCLDRLSNSVTWVEGECYVKDLVEVLVDEITNASVPMLDNPNIRSSWNKVYAEREYSYVKYSVDTRTVAGEYEHEYDNGDKIKYRVYQIPERTGFAIEYSDGNYLHEMTTSTPVGNPLNYPEHRTGKYLDYTPLYVGGKTYEIEGSLAVVVDLYPDRAEKTFEDVNDKYQAYMVQHSRIDYKGNKVEDFNWNSFEIIAPLPDHWTYALRRTSIVYARYTAIDGNDRPYTSSRTQTTRSNYSVSEFVFTPTLYRVPSRGLIRQDDPTYYDSTKKSWYYWLYFEKPLKDNNYIKVSYIVDYNKHLSFRNLVGDPEESYRDACSINDRDVVTVINPLEAYYAYERQVDGSYYREGFFEFRSDSGLEFGTDDVISSYWFISSNTALTWIPNRMRDEYSLVRYSLSIGHDRLAMVLEGDPSFDPDSAYISFAYAGRIKSLSEEDDKYNYALTTGMGTTVKNLSNIEFKDINKEQNPYYAKYGRFTSNGMDTVSLFKGKSGLLYQEYRPAFLTQLPNYPTVGTLPPGIVRGRMTEFFQPSEHTDHFHSSPIYLVHGYEGYRGYLDGVVAIHDIGLVGGDEMDYHLEGYTEIYKVFKIDTPISFLDKSPAPKNMIIAILKEIK